MEADKRSFCAKDEVTFVRIGELLRVECRNVTNSKNTADINS